MTGFEPGISGVGSDRSTNWGTTTAPMKQRFRIEVYVAVQLQRTVEMMATGWQKSLRQFSAENVVLTKEDLGPNAIKFSLEELVDNL